MENSGDRSICRAGSGSDKMTMRYDDFDRLPVEEIENVLLDKIHRHGPGFLNQPSVDQGQSLLLESVYREHKQLVKVILRVAQKKNIALVLGSTKGKTPDCLKMAIEHRNWDIAKRLLVYIRRGPVDFSETSRILSNSFSESFRKSRPTARSILLNSLMSDDFCLELGTVDVPDDFFGSENPMRIGLHDESHPSSPCQDDLLGFLTDIHPDLALQDRDFSPVTAKGQALVVPIANFVKTGRGCLLRKLTEGDIPNRAFKSLAVEALVVFKWGLYGHRQATREMFVYLILLISFFSYTLSLGHYAKNGGEVDTGSTESVLNLGLLVLSVVMACYHLIKEIKHFYFYSRDTFLSNEFIDSKMGNFKFLLFCIRWLFDWTITKWNVLELMSYCSVAILVPFLHVKHSPLLPVLVGATNILLWWKMLYFFQLSPQMAHLVIAIFEIRKDMISFLLLALSVLLGFGLAFFVLFLWESGDDIEQAFGTLPRSCFSTFAMLLGLFDLEVFYSMQHNETTAIFLFFFYVMAMVMVLLNLLISIMSDSFDRVKQYEETSFIKAKARILEDMEMSHKNRQGPFPKFMHILVPYSDDEADGKDYSQEQVWRGRMNHIEHVLRGIVMENSLATRNKINQNLESTFGSLNASSKDLTGEVREMMKRIEGLEERLQGPLNK
ncbi:hypothetical protein BSKO_07699 [Bryopsis sp. KO-2023]|nr:hypothetical protein BSKO_07699 [Bryopsis sp. KO-2023]